METHLERKTVLSEESEHKSLYRWFLHEPDDKAVKRHQIPWPWTQWFKLSDMVFNCSLKKDNYGLKGDDEPVVTQKEYIRAKLVPFEKLGSKCRYSMFGTDREISEFDLTIYATMEGEEERCLTWGGVSYTSEIDFRHETQPDYVGWSIHVNPSRFANLVALVTSRSVSAGTFRVGGVEGFYSDWSPSITTSHVKVLTNDEDSHPVETSEACTIQPPRLGDVGEFDLSLVSETSFASELEEAPEEWDSPQPDIGPQLQLLPVSDPAAVALLRSVRLAAWVIAGGLAVIVLKLVL